ncbi:MAG: lipocalin-like domain-containing protein [Pseudohongiellaceae bacterium]
MRKLVTALTAPALCRQLRLVLVLPWLALLQACGEDIAPPTAAITALNLQAALGGEAEAGFLRADAARTFSFPADHARHPGFRNEWWYFTGNLAADDGRRFGYQLTFFSIAIKPPGPSPQPASTWDSDTLWMAHFALTDAEGDSHHAFERFSRGNPALAGAQATPWRVWLDDWRVDGSATPDSFPWQLHASADGLELSLQLQPGKGPVLQGEAGLSRKSATPGNASYYYSYPRLPSMGEVRLGDARFNVQGSSWLDREWSTSALDADQGGWDWFSLQFDDGSELMYYQLRTLQGESHPASAGSFTAADGRQTALAASEIRLQPLREWTSPSGTAYTTQWSLRWREREIEVRAIVQEQWMNLSLPYWEGAVEIIDAKNGSSLGRGYLEMVR